MQQIRIEQPTATRKHGSEIQELYATLFFQQYHQIIGDLYPDPIDVATGYDYSSHQLQLLKPWKLSMPLIAANPTHS